MWGVSRLRWVKPARAFAFEMWQRCHAKPMSTDPTPSTSILAPGTLVGPYEIIQFVARGGMGIVYRARHRTLKEDVALKVLYPHLTGEGEFAIRFQREAATMAKLRHPHIAHVLNADVANGVHYLALAYAPNGTLRQWLDRAPKKQLTVVQALAITRQIALALQHAHTNGIVHRDIKPSNFLVAADGRFLLTDFGIAQVTSEPKITKNLASMGTPEYMSPEQGQGLKVDSRSDIYALGIILYEMLAGRPPFSSDNHLATLFQHAKDTPTQINNYRPDVSPAMRNLVNKMLAKHPKDRVQTADEVVRMIDRIAVSKASAGGGRGALMAALGAVAVLGLGAAGWLWVRSASPAAKPVSAPMAAPAIATSATATSSASIAKPTATLVVAVAPVSPLPPVTTEVIAGVALTPTSTQTPAPLATSSATPSQTALPATATETPTASAATATASPSAIPTQISTTTPAPTQTSEPTTTPQPTVEPSATPQPEATQTPEPTQTAGPSRTPAATRTPGATPTPRPTPTKPNATPGTPTAKLQGLTVAAGTIGSQRWTRSPEWDGGNPNVCSYINSAGDPARAPLWQFNLSVRVKNTTRTAIRVSPGNWSLTAKNGYRMLGCFAGATIPPGAEANMSVRTFFEKDRLVPYKLELLGINQAVCFRATGNQNDISQANLSFVFEKCSK